MNKTLLKNLIMIVATIFMMICINIVAFAEASIIYAPTSAAKETEKVEVENEVSKEEVIEPYTYASYEQSASIDYNNVYMMVELDGNYYCYEGDDIAKKAWRKIRLSSFQYYGIPIDGFNNDYIWMYFQSNGKAVKSNTEKFKKMKIDGYDFAFNQYGQMLEGFFNDECEMWNGDREQNLFDLVSSDNNLYYADPNNGVLYSGWLTITNDTDDLYEKKEHFSFYFMPSNYRAVKSNGNGYKIETINGKKYAFDDKGILLTGFEAYDYNVENGISDSSIKYFGDNGAMSSGFITAIPSENLDSERYEDDEELTFYLNSSGNLYKNMIKKIGNYYYGFDDKGAVIKNLSVWRNGAYVATIDPEETDGRAFILYGSYTTKDNVSMTLDSTKDVIHYFNKTGKRVVSDITIDFADNLYTYDASNSGAYNGQKSKKFYKNGLLMKPTECKYGIYVDLTGKTNYNMNELCNNNNVYVLNKSGAKVTSKTGQKDDDDNYWLVSSAGNLLNIYSLNVKYSSGKYYFKSESGSSDNEKWILFGEPDNSGRTCVLECVPNGTRLANGAITAYQITPGIESCLNFILN